jgi:vitamin B12 transporter
MKTFAFRKTNPMYKPVFLLLSTLIINTLYSQTDSLSWTLPDVIIQENRVQLPIREQSRSVQVLTAQQIAALPVRSVNELLLQVSGVDVRQRGPHGVQADVGIRGGTFDQTLILVNGIKLSDPQTGHHNMNLPFDLAAIERIEILKGPAARVFGQNAFSGAINIVTKTPVEDGGQVQVRGGENGLWGLAAQLQFAGDKMSQMLTLSHDAADGYRYNTDYEISTAFYQNQIELGTGQLGLTAGWSQRKFGANGFYASPEFQDQYEEISTSLLNLTYRLHPSTSWQLTTRAYWRRNVDDYVFVRSNPEVYQNIHTGHSYGWEGHANYRGKWGTTGLGAEINRIELSSNNLGERQRNMATIFVEQRMNWGDFDLTPGFSLSHYSDFGLRFFPGIDLGYRLHARIKLFANTGYTYRVPTFTDLYYEDRANNGNPDLQPEAAIAYEVGAKYERPGLQVQVALFRRDGLDLIDWTRASDTAKWTPINITELSTQGVEIGLTTYLPLLLPELAFLERFHFSYTCLDAQLANNDAVFSRYALENLRHQLTMGIIYRPLKRLQHSLTYRYSDRVNLADYQLVDTRLTYTRERWEVFCEATNLFDTAYQETNLVPMPGRWLRFGGQYRW